MNSAAPYVTAAVLLLAVTAYSTAGGVDFGAGIWDLLAGSGPKGRQARPTAQCNSYMQPVVPHAVGIYCSPVPARRPRKIKKGEM